MMKLFVSVLLMALLASQTFSLFVMDAAFLVNRNYIADTLCENKGKPQLHCNGKCYLSKQIEKENKNETQTPALKKEKSSAPLFSLPEEVLLVHYSSSIKRSHSFLQCQILSFYHCKVFQPPKFFFV